MKKFEDLVALMARLRAEGGCPWDREQTLESLKPFVIEEAYEVVDAIDRGDMNDLREEVGDHLLEAVFVSQIAAEEGHFTIDEAITAIHDKLVRRHPHVFSDVQAGTASEVLTNWEKQKNEERKLEDKSILSGVPASLPGMLKASRITEKAARVGFDWERMDDIFEKIDEEVAELREAIARNDRREIEHELGDLLFTIANIARRIEVNPEEAVQSANRRFRSRFEHVEKRLRQEGRDFSDSNLQEMEALWSEAKTVERG